MKKTVVMITIAAFALMISASLLLAQDDMQEAKASLLGAGVKFNMDKPSMRARNQSSQEDNKEAIKYDSMKGGLLDGVFGGEGGQGIRTRPIKDTKLLCEVCKAKAVLHSSESCEYCKGQSYANLCDKCIAWSILNSCDECKAKISGAKSAPKAADKKEKAKETLTETASEPAEKEVVKEETPKADAKIEEITPDEEPAVKKETAKKAAKSSKKKKSQKKPAAEETL